MYEIPEESAKYKTIPVNVLTLHPGYSRYPVLLLRRGADGSLPRRQSGPDNTRSRQVASVYVKHYLQEL